MTFEEYLTKRRVNVAAFASAEPLRFAEWQNWFGQMHPESFYMLVKMVLNDVRRNYWLAEVPKPIAAPEATAESTAAPARPAGRRAAMGRPTTATPESTSPEIQTDTTAKPATGIPATKPVETVTATANNSEEAAAAKPARPVFKPRGVIKKATETSPEGVTPETSESEKTAAANPTEEVKPATENAEETSAKPARPRAVIKRPAALAKPTDSTEEKPEASSEKPISDISETPGNLPENPVIDTTSEAAKPARPRPVFKRPTVTASSENSNSETDKTPEETPQIPAAISATESPVENPVAKPGQEGASEAKAVSEEIHDNPEAAKAAEEVAAEAGIVPKPPRPRPVFKRPPATTSTPENPALEPKKTLGETAQKPGAESAGVQPEKSAEMATNTGEKEDEPAEKPARPRPVFKRPAKPPGNPENPL